MERTQGDAGLVLPLERGRGMNADAVTAITSVFEAQAATVVACLKDCEAELAAMLELIEKMKQDYR